MFLLTDDFGTQHTVCLVHGSLSMDVVISSVVSLLKFWLRFLETLFPYRYSKEAFL